MHHAASHSSVGPVPGNLRYRGRRVQVSGAAGTSGFVAEFERNPVRNARRRAPPPGSDSAGWTPTATARFARRMARQRPVVPRPRLEQRRRAVGEGTARGRAPGAGRELEDFDNVTDERLVREPVRRPRSQSRRPHHQRRVALRPRQLRARRSQPRQHLTRAEFLGGDFDDDRGDRFDYLDADGNNRVDPSRSGTPAPMPSPGSTQPRRHAQPRRGRRRTPMSTPAPTCSRGSTPIATTASAAASGTGRAQLRPARANGDGVLSRREMAGADVDGHVGPATVKVGHQHDALDRHRRVRLRR